MKKIVLTIITLLPGLVWAGPQEVRAAAEKGSPEMQLELGELYEFGFGLKQNYVPALAWYTLAAEQGNEKAVKRRDALRARMTPEQIEQAQAQVQLIRQQSTAPSAATPSPGSVTPSPEPAPPAPSVSPSE